MEVLKRDFLPKELHQIYTHQGISGSVAIQAEQSEEETEFLLELADIHLFILGVVGWVDLRHPELPSRLEHYSARKRLKGFRHLVQDEPDARFLMDPSFQKGLGSLEKYGYTFDLLVYPHQMEAAIQTVRNFPALKFVLDHMGKPDIKNGKLRDWANSIKTLALEPNVYCKVSGMVTEASWTRWQLDDFIPYLDTVFQAFGTDRLMFGSDWPVCLVAAKYAAVINTLLHYMGGFSEQDKHKLFYENTKNFYGLHIPY
jgi:L-fuconolactonase